MIPHGWKAETLSDGIDLISGRHVLAKDYSDISGGTPYITGPSDFSDGKITATKYTLSPDVLCKEGDTLITVKGSGTGQVIFSNKTYCISRQLMAVRPQHWDKKFIFYFLSYNLPRYSRLARGLIPGISREDVLFTPILVPSLPEQHKIAEILSTWEEAIDRTKRLIAALQQRKKGLMQHLLTGEVRFPESDGQWKEMQLGQFLKPTLRKVEKPKEAYLRLGVRSHGKGMFISTIDDVDTVAMTHLFKVKRGDLIVSITFAWEGAIAIVGQDEDGALVSHRFPTYTFDTKKVLPEYFRYLMLTKRFFYDLGLISPGGAGRNRVMSKTDFLKLRVKVPSVEEQKKIGGILVATDDYIGVLLRQLALLKEQKKGLMQCLLTGQVRVRVG